jgi:hypothetical protein
MNAIYKFRFSPFQFLLSAVVCCLRPLCVPLEVAVRTGLGERYGGFAFAVGVLVMATWSLLASAPLLGLAAGAVVVWAVVQRVRCVQSRVRGGPSVHTRSPGSPLLARAMPGVPVQAVLWVEPLAAIALGFAVATVMSADLGNYLICAGAALLVVSFARTLAAYHRQLDRIDAEVERLDAGATVIGPRDVGPLFAAPARGFPLDDVPLLPAVDAAPAQ